MERKTEIKKRLDSELKQLHFTKEADVLSKVNRPTWRDKFQQLWNKEVTIPILPVSSVLVLLLFSYGTATIQHFNEEIKQQETIEIGGSIYLKEEIKGRVTNEE